MYSIFGDEERKRDQEKKTDERRDIEKQLCQDRGGIALIQLNNKAANALRVRKSFSDTIRLCEILYETIWKQTIHKIRLLDVVDVALLKKVLALSLLPRYSP